VKTEYETGQQNAGTITKKPTMRALPGYWDNYFGGRYKAEYETETGLSTDGISELTEKLTTYPPGFHIHAKVKKLLEQRAEMGAGERDVDYGMAEALAFASLVKGGIPIRMSGQDSRRGTFNQRHSVLLDIEDETEYVPLRNIAATSTIQLFPKLESWDSSMVTAATIPKPSFCGKRSSAISPTWRKRSSINL
jgi:2-oxoglutarate dehydrogenase E1 component